MDALAFKKLRKLTLTACVTACMTAGFTLSVAVGVQAKTMALPQQTRLDILQKTVAYERLIHTFYEAFARGDAETMARCYHPEVRFEDPAFGVLKGKQASDMWRMLLSQASDLEVRHKYVQVQLMPDGVYRGQAHWDADYTFSLTGNKVNNQIDASFTFKDGLIYTHTDRFDTQRWASMALGLPGVFFGGHDFFKNALQRTARQRLEDFQAAAGSAEDPARNP